jgi:hypothetical protein
VTSSRKRPVFSSFALTGSTNTWNLEWAKLSQDSLKELQTLAATNRDTKLAEFVVPYIEIPEEEIIKKTQVEIKPAPRLERPAKGSLTRGDVQILRRSGLSVVALCREHLRRL